MTTLTKRDYKNKEIRYKGGGESASGKGAFEDCGFAQMGEGRVFFLILKSKLIKLINKSFQ